MARLTVQLSNLCRPQSARGQVLTRPISALMRTEGDDSATGPGWYESSLDLQRGLLVRESTADDRLLREWHEAVRRLAAREAGSPRPSAHATEHMADHRAGQLLLTDKHSGAAVVRYPGGLDFVV
jgi:hypothetical protein